MHRLILFMALVLGVIPTAAAQEFGRLEETLTNAAYFFHARPGEATVQVSALGALRQPGVYEVKLGTHLGKLLSLTGGPLESIRQGTVRRETVIRLTRPFEDSSRVIYAAQLEDMLAATPRNYPVLQEGDVIMVQITERRGFGWRDALGIVSALASVSLIVERLVR